MRQLFGIALLSQKNCLRTEVAEAFGEDRFALRSIPKKLEKIEVSVRPAMLPAMIHVMVGVRPACYDRWSHADYVPDILCRERRCKPSANCAGTVGFLAVGKMQAVSAEGYRNQRYTGHNLLRRTEKLNSDIEK